MSSRDNYTTRLAARAVVMDDQNKVALLHVTRDHYYKLPGGGIDEGEDPRQALERELMEEIGCKAEVIDELGTVLEQRYFWNMTQVSYCFTARQIGEKSKPDFTDEERDAGFEIVWSKNIDEAITLLESSAETADPDELEVKFMRMRDVAIAKRAK
jgi:ADP-ribose pyrophosphatase YjhB (NUDIX family)